VAFPQFHDVQTAFIAHDQANQAALACSLSVGFAPMRRFIEDGASMLLLQLDRGRLGVRPRSTVGQPGIRLA
jgi:hypothetical protein